MRYAGMQNHKECFCGGYSISHDRYGQASQSDCDRVCHGDTSQMCGGNDRNSVFELKRKLGVPSKRMRNVLNVRVSVQYILFVLVLHG